MTERIIREANWGHNDFVLTSGEVAEKGHMACFDTSTGEVVPGQLSTTLLPIGWFAESLTGDGVKKVAVRLFEEIAAAWWQNDSAGTPVLAADVGQECYVLNSSGVTMDSSGASKAGRVLAVDSLKGVLVQAGLAVAGPTGGAGASVLGGTVADMTALKAIAAAARANGKLVLVQADGSLWRFAESSALADTSEQLVATPAVGSGRWLRADRAFVMRLAIGFGTADAAVLHTVPAGFVLKLAAHPFYEITTPFTGGTASGIGLSSNRTGYSTKGDLIDESVEADLDTGIQPGTIGDKLDSLAELAALFFEAGNTIRHDRITDAFAAGAGFVRVPVVVVTAPASA